MAILIMHVPLIIVWFLLYRAKKLCLRFMAFTSFTTVFFELLIIMNLFPNRVPCSPPEGFYCQTESISIALVGALSQVIGFLVLFLPPFRRALEKKGIRC